MIDKRALDRHITGNWGEDSVPELPPPCEDCEYLDSCPDPGVACEKIRQWYLNQDQPKPTPEELEDYQ